MTGTKREESSPLNWFLVVDDRKECLDMEEWKDALSRGGGYAPSMPSGSMLAVEGRRRSSAVMTQRIFVVLCSCAPQRGQME